MFQLRDKHEKFPSPPTPARRINVRTTLPRVSHVILNVGCVVYRPLYAGFFALFTGGGASSSMGYGKRAPPVRGTLPDWFSGSGVLGGSGGGSVRCACCVVTPGRLVIGSCCRRGCSS